MEWFSNRFIPEGGLAFAEVDHSIGHSRGDVPELRFDGVLVNRGNVDPWRDLH